MDSHRNDILLVEQIAPLTRLRNSDWMTLKKQFEKFMPGKWNSCFHFQRWW
ncbi:hypothetical protein L579_4302 [Pantoea sp. AS-PWVM4]|nr:hypothetical protein L579_4302 [Pantoea sp. AS-PWVM4]